MTNRLRIRAKSLNLDLVGEAEYITRAYDAIHTLLLERFQESVEGVLEEDVDAPPARDPMAETIPMHQAVDPKMLQTGRPQHINVVVCNEVYNKIYLVDRDELSSTIFSRVLHLPAVNRIYINRSQREGFREFFKFGKVLWRELTAAGKAVVKGT